MPDAKQIYMGLGMIGTNLVAGIATIGFGALAGYNAAQGRETNLVQVVQYSTISQGVLNSFFLGTLDNSASSVLRGASSGVVLGALETAVGFSAGYLIGKVN
ncbi:hypothetical protein HZA97_03220 [Candidatus Woesearchaeota archaeon]|nr:hypothetical protein [Candidatus Woesearchaeota archaeon]